MTNRVYRPKLAIFMVLLLVLALGIAVALAQTEVAQIGSNTVVSGTAALTTTAGPISATTVPVRELLLQCDAANLVDCYLGSATVQVVHLAPGQSLSIPVANLQLLYAKTASSTATLNYLGRR